MIPQEGRPLAGGVDARPRGERLGERAGVLSGQRQVGGLHGDEVEHHVELVAGVRSEELALLGMRHVDLAQHHRVAPAAGHEGAELLHDLVGIHGHGFRRCVGRVLRQEGDGVNAEAVHPQLQPETHRAENLVHDLRVGHVEVRLVGVEVVQVPLAGAVVARPDAVLLVREDDLVGGVPGVGVAPDVVVAVGVVLARAGFLEPRVLVGGVVDEQVDDDPDAAVVRRADDLHEFAVVAQSWIDPVEILDVVAVIPVGARVEGHQPEGVDAELRQVVDALSQTAQVAAAVAVGVQVGLDVEAVDNRALPPQVAGVGDAHGGSSLRRSRFGLGCGRSVSARAGRPP